MQTQTNAQKYPLWVYTFFGNCFLWSARVRAHILNALGLWNENKSLTKRILLWTITFFASRPLVLDMILGDFNGQKCHQSTLCV